MIQVFFYGLFMDVGLLRKKGLNPSQPAIGYLNHYELKIGNRASLIPCRGAKAYGVVVRVNADAIEALYQEPSVADYVAEEVSIVLEDGVEVNAVCYNLQVNKLKGTNPDYAKALYQLAKDIGLPYDYLEIIKSFS